MSSLYFVPMIRHPQHSPKTRSCIILDIFNSSPRFDYAIGTFKLVLVASLSDQ